MSDYNESSNRRKNDRRSNAIDYSKFTVERRKSGDRRVSARQEAVKQSERWSTYKRELARESVQVAFKKKVLEKQQDMLYIYQQSLVNKKKKEKEEIEKKKQVITEKKRLAKGISMMHGLDINLPYADSLINWQNKIKAKNSDKQTDKTDKNKFDNNLGN